MKGTSCIIQCVYLTAIEWGTNTTQDSELLSTSTESLEREQIFQCMFYHCACHIIYFALKDSDDVNTQCDIEDKEIQATTKSI